MSKLTMENVVVGLDLGDRYSWFCVLDEDGEVVEEGRIPSTESGLRRWFGARDTACVALEVGTHSPWVSRLLKALGHDVIVANARHVRMIYGGDRKSDRLDAEALARLARLDPALLHGIEHRTARAHEDLAVIRHPRAGGAGTDAHPPDQSRAGGGQVGWTQGAALQQRLVPPDGSRSHSARNEACARSAPRDARTTHPRDPSL